jgi:protein-L-isoaspartate(D-aspartate) O-methyltransferase
MPKHQAPKPPPRPAGSDSPAATAVEDGTDLLRDRRRGLRARRLLPAAVLAMLSVVPRPAEPGDPQTAERRAMVEEQLLRRGIRQEAVLAAMARVPRHEFVAAEARHLAYADRPLPIGHSQTISQPYVVALMTELLDLRPGARVLEIGTGSGYHAAVLSRLAAEVYTIEIVRPLGERARDTLARLGYDNVQVRIGDGYRGWPEEAPFDAILLTAAPPEVPAPLLEQLKVGGKLVLPEGRGEVQDLLVVTRTAESLERQRVAAVRFVPMTGEAQRTP